MDKEERLSRQMEFCREIDKEKQILRQTILSNGIQREDDSQHAWHMAVMTLLLSEYSNEPIDVLKTISMLLIHDLVEIDAGDTFAYDEEGKKTQISGINSAVCGMSLRRELLRRHYLPILWTIYSLRC